MAQAAMSGARALAVDRSEGLRVLQGRREYVTYPDDASVRIWYSDTPQRYAAHLHSAVEILLVMEGTVDYTVEDKVFQVRKGEILIIPPDTIHSLAMGENSSRYIFLFEADTVMGMRDVKAMDKYFRRPFHLRDGGDAFIRIREMLIKMNESYQKQELLWNTVCCSYLLRIYSLLSQWYIPGISRVAGGEIHSMRSEVFSAVLTYINDHYKEEISLDTVADFSGFSRYYFSRSFRHQTGYSFKEYLCRKRLEAAMDLLTRTTRPIRDVAAESGFGSVATFNRLFRESKGCTPSQYRVISQMI